MFLQIQIFRETHAPTTKTKKLNSYHDAQSLTSESQYSRCRILNQSMNKAGKSNKRQKEVRMIYNQHQQEILIQDFIDALLVERNLSPKTLYAYKNDLLNLSNWLNMRRYMEINARSIYEYFFYLQNEIELSPRSIRRKYVSIQQYCQYIKNVLNTNETFFSFTARKFQLPQALPKTLSKEENRLSEP